MTRNKTLKYERSSENTCLQVSELTRGLGTGKSLGAGAGWETEENGASRDRRAMGGAPGKEVGCLRPAREEKEG